MPPTHALEHQPCPPASFPNQGFVDAHVHLIPAGLSLTRVDLRGAPTVAEFKARVAAGAAALAADDWVLGGLWDEQTWGGALPNRTWLDEVRRCRAVLHVDAWAQGGGGEGEGGTVPTSARSSLRRTVRALPRPLMGLVLRDVGQATGAFRPCPPCPPCACLRALV